jgi:diguanylate cyclase (GGDEF)-like protein
MSHDPNRRILVIDDNPAIHEDFRQILAGEARAESGDARELDDLEARAFGGALGTRGRGAAGYAVDVAAQGEEGYRLLCDRLGRGERYAAAFVDMRMPPGWDGVETIENLWRQDPGLQVVVCTAWSDHAWPDVVRRLGATDRLLVLKKPFDTVEVAQLALALTEKWNLAQRAQLKLDQLEELVRARTRDLAELNARLQYDALHDRLTGLSNRALLSDRLTRCIQRAKRVAAAGGGFALLFLDLDRFKLVNDSLGHVVGDKLLKAVADRLLQCVRGVDAVCRSTSEPAVARLGGDEFTILLEDLRDPAADAARVAERIGRELARPCVIEGHEIVTSASIGIAPGGPDYEQAEDLLRDADAALYRAKAAGKNRYAVFDASLHDGALARLTLENDLRHALPRNELLLHYQPIVALDSGSPVGFEALLRWRHPSRGMVSPAEFIPTAEDMGLIIPFGAWAMAEACRQLRQWQDGRPSAAAPLTMSVNLSRRQLNDPDLVAHVRRVLAETGIPPSSVKLEITESTIMEDPARTCAVLAEIRALGVQLDMDDFGTGYSSLSCLNRFDLDGLKLDRGFIQAMCDSREQLAVIQTILLLARNLGMRVVAEGVETAEQVALLQGMECDQAQGYHFARPLAPEAAAAYLAAAAKIAA